MKSRLIVVLEALRSSTDGVTKVTVLWHSCCKVCYRFREGECFVMVVTETNGRVKTKVWSCL